MRTAVALALVSTLAIPLAAAPGGSTPTLKGVPPPPDGVYEAEMTEFVMQKAEQERKALLAELDRDPSRTAAEKKAIREKASRLRVVIYTTTKPLMEVATFYEQKVRDAAFVFGARDLVADATEAAAANGLSLDAAAAKAWEGKSGTSARWSRADRTLAIDAEDHLIDPRDGSIKKKTVVLVSATD